MPGDDLWAIAARFLGNGEHWHELFRLNAGKPQPDGRTLTDPSLIYPGWVLLLPSHDGHQGPAARPGHHRPRRPAPARTPGPAPSRTRQHEGGGTPSPAATGAHPHSRPVAVHLPSGALIGISVAIMVAAALTLASIQRRRRYRPRASMTGSLQPGEPPLPAVITALRRAARPAPGDTLDDDDGPDPGTPPVIDPYLDPYHDTLPGPGQHGEAAPGGRPAPGPEPAGQSPPHPAAAGTDPPPARAPGTIPLGVRGTSEAALDVAALGGLGLTGPGAPAAARAILAALLAQAPPAEAGMPAGIIIPAADAVRLLPGEDTAQIPGVSVPATLEAALDEMEAVLLSQARTSGAFDAGDGPQATASAAGTPRPGAALIATCDPRTTQRLRGIVESGRGLGAAAILLGPWQPGVTCQVAADGMITDVTPSGAGLEGIPAVQPRRRGGSGHHRRAARRPQRPARRTGPGAARHRKPARQARGRRPARAPPRRRPCTFPPPQCPPRQLPPAQQTPRRNQHPALRSLPPGPPPPRRPARLPPQTARPRPRIPPGRSS